MEQAGVQAREEEEEGEKEREQGDRHEEADLGRGYCRKRCECVSHESFSQHLTASQGSTGSGLLGKTASLLETQPVCVAFLSLFVVHTPPPLLLAVCMLSR